MINSELSTGWWQVVKALAGFVADGYEENELTEIHVKKDLLALGFLETDIAQAFKWVEKAELSGHLFESLSMLQQQPQGLRLTSPLEKACLSEYVMNQIQACRLRGLLSQDFVEKIIEGLRVLDVRDWDEDEVHGVLIELLATVMPGATRHEIVDLIGGKKPTYHS